MELMVVAQCKLKNRRTYAAIALFACFAVGNENLSLYSFLTRFTYPYIFPTKFPSGCHSLNKVESLDLVHSYNIHFGQYTQSMGSGRPPWAAGEYIYLRH